MAKFAEALDRDGLAASVIGYNAQHQASEARRSAKRSFAPTIGFAGLCRSLQRRWSQVQYPLIGPGLCGLPRISLLRRWGIRWREAPTWRLDVTPARTERSLAVSQGLVVAVYSLDLVEAPPREKGI